MNEALSPAELSGPRYYDNSAIAAYKDCPRKFYLRHVLGWRSNGISLPLTFGLSWHSAMDVVWQYYGSFSEKDLLQMAHAKFCETWEAQGLEVELDVEKTEAFAPRTPMIALEMLYSYLDTRRKMLEDATRLAIEQPFAVPLPGMNNVWYIGRLDKVIEFNSQKLVIEHKTSTEYKKDGGFKTSYVEGWYSDSQVKGYQFGGGLFFPGLTQVWVDAALVHKQVHNAFRLIPVAHQFPLLEEFISDTREWIQRIERDIVAEREALGLAPGVFPKNENSCMGKFGACSFLNICRTNSRPDQLETVPEGYMVEHWRPFELLGIDKLLNKEPQNA